MHLVSPTWTMLQARRGAPQKVLAAVAMLGIMAGAMAVVVTAASGWLAVALFLLVALLATTALALVWHLARRAAPGLDRRVVSIGIIGDAVEVRGLWRCAEIPVGDIVSIDVDGADLIMRGVHGPIVVRWAGSRGAHHARARARSMRREALHAPLRPDWASGRG